MNDALLERLSAAHHKVAQLVLIDPVYLPIFVRLEAEIVAAQTSSNTIARARAVAANHRATA
tara:strand:+ start:3376 stop:3561 length:186 start_codon:yes stop_codon:yes gene_type:complete